jgi:long-chain fatty acid transport protein
MSNQRPSTYFKNILTYITACFLLSPLPLYASFIEATIGTAVVNDATATYHNPAALTLLKNSQIIALGSIGYFQNQFTGQAIQSTTGFTQSGTTNNRTHYYLPTFYLGMPVKNNVTVGLAVIANNFNSNIGEQSILRYVQSSNQIQDIDLVPAIGFKINEFVALGAGLSLSRAHFLMQPISGLPSLNIPDSHSRNDSSGTSWGGDIGLLLKPTASTLMGFNYRSAVTYRLSGTSTFNGNPSISSNNYHFKYWTPARSLFSISHFVTQKLGLISTIQYIQWNIFKDVTIYDIATRIGSQSVILPSANIHYHFHNTWLLTLGSQYQVSPAWIIRVAGSYIQSPSNRNYQIGNGDNIVLGTSVGYQFSKNILIDGSYAHAFIKNENIHITTGPYIINGVNKGSGDALSLKLTVNVC